MGKSFNRRIKKYWFVGISRSAQTMYWSEKPKDLMPGMVSIGPFKTRRGAKWYMLHSKLRTTIKAAELAARKEMTSLL